MAITLDDVEALKRELEELPRNQPRQVTKQEAIAMLASHLGAAKRRGYSPEELANLLSRKGIAINTATLRGYLRRNRKKRSHAGNKTTRGGVSSVTPSAHAQRPTVFTTASAPVASATPPRSPAVGGQEQPAVGTRTAPDTKGNKDTPSGGR